MLRCARQDYAWKGRAGPVDDEKWRASRPGRTPPWPVSHAWTQDSPHGLGRPRTADVRRPKGKTRTVTGRLARAPRRSTEPRERGADRPDRSADGRRGPPAVQLRRCASRQRRRRSSQAHAVEAPWMSRWRPPWSTSLRTRCALAAVRGQGAPRFPRSARRRRIGPARRRTAIVFTTFDARPDSRPRSRPLHCKLSLCHAGLPNRGRSTSRLMWCLRGGGAAAPSGSAVDGDGSYEGAKSGAGCEPPAGASRQTATSPATRPARRKEVVRQEFAFLIRARGDRRPAPSWRVDQLAATNETADTVPPRRDKASTRSRRRPSGVDE